MKFLKLTIYFLCLVVWQQNIFALTGIYTAIESGFARQSGLPDQANAKAKDLNLYYYPNGRLSVGYIHDFNPIIGLGFEAAVGYYGKATYDYPDYTSREVKSTTSEFLAVLTTHIKQVDLFGKAGGIRHTITGVNKGDDHDKSAIQSEIIIGTAYNFNEHVALSLSYLHAFGQSINDLTNVDDKSLGLDAVLGGLRFTFW